jgi:hypothetical protein
MRPFRKTAEFVVPDNGRYPVSVPGGPLTCLFSKRPGNNNGGVDVGRVITTMGILRLGCVKIYFQLPLSSVFLLTTDKIS